MLASFAPVACEDLSPNSYYRSDIQPHDKAQSIAAARRRGQEGAEEGDEARRGAPPGERAARGRQGRRGGRARKQPGVPRRLEAQVAGHAGAGRVPEEKAGAATTGTFDGCASVEWLFMLARVQDVSGDSAGFQLHSILCCMDDADSAWHR